MQKLSQSQKDSIRDAAWAYYQQMPGSPAEEYLASRGLDQSQEYLGYVAEHLPGHEQYVGMLAIPYMRYLRPDSKPTVVSIRFRCIRDHEHQGHGKYNTIHGDRPRLYNTRDLLWYPQDEIAITEGELDALTSSLAGVRAVGVPGATAWKPWFTAAFLGHRTVHVIADGDEPGVTFCRSVVHEIPGARPVYMPPGYDANSFVLKHGAEEFVRYVQKG